MRFFVHKQPAWQRIHKTSTDFVVPGGNRGRSTPQLPPDDPYLFEDGTTYQFEDGTDRAWEIKTP